MFIAGVIGAAEGFSMGTRKCVDGLLMLEGSPVAAVARSRFGQVTGVQAYWIPGFSLWVLGKKGGRGGVGLDFVHASWRQSGCGVGGC